MEPITLLLIGLAISAVGGGISGGFSYAGASKQVEETERMNNRLFGQQAEESAKQERQYGEQMAFTRQKFGYEKKMQEELLQDKRRQDFVNGLIGSINSSRALRADLLNTWRR